MSYFKSRLFHFFVVLTLCLTVSTTVFADGHVLVVEKTDGHVYRFQLSTKPEISFGTTTVRFANAVTTVQMPRSEMKEFRFVKSSDMPTSVNSPSQPLHRVRNMAENVVVENLQPSDKVRLIDANGRVYTAHQQSSSTVQFSLSSLPKGIYIIQINQQETIKFVRK